MIYYIIPILIFLGGQFYKLLAHSVAGGKFQFKYFGLYGRMPSTHSAMVASLSTVTGYASGFDSPVFAVAIIISLIVIHDAARLRRLISKQSEILNQTLAPDQEHLPTNVGHSWPEIVIGVLYGILASILLLKIL